MDKLAPVPERNGTRFVHMHPTYRIAHQSARRRWNSDRVIGSLPAGDRVIPEHPADDAAQEPQSPGKDKQPKQKSHDASKKVHLNDCELNGRFCLITLEWAVRAVYARRKGCVKRKGVISRGCEANCFLPAWGKTSQYSVKPFVYNELWKYSGYFGVDSRQTLKLQIRRIPRLQSAAGMRSMPMYGRRTSGIKIEPSAC